ncbi:MAG: site-specific integrase [Flavobacteriales bacterium]|nr:site-specific integrase [Flavobacteriales bacterium]
MLTGHSALINILGDTMMQKLLLTELIRDLEQEMLQLGYSNRSMQFYRSRWKQLLKFAKERGENFYSEQLGLDFVEKHFHIFEKDDNRGLSKREIQEPRIIRVVGDFQLRHIIVRRSYFKHKDILTYPLFIALRKRFQSYCERKEYSRTTTNDHVRKATRFMHYLTSQNVIDCEEISLPLIHAYIKTLAGSGYAYETLVGNIRSMRAFFRFLLETGEVQIDFAAKIPMIQARKQTCIPSVWTKDELQKLIAAIDRGSPKGKRDYAIILLACCLGMRVSDIINLKKEDFHWENKKLVFIQSKTKTSLSLPLTPEVGWAVIEYLKYGRPNIDSPYLFVKHKAPFGPFAEGSNLYELIRRYIGLANLPTLQKKRGMHSLRHTLASQLLEKDTPLSTISDILGHVNTNSTAVYLKVGMQKLKELRPYF